MKKVAVFIDGGQLRACAKQANRDFTPSFVVNVAKALVIEGEELLRIQYFDCDPFSGSVKLPISGSLKKFHKPDPFLGKLAIEELVAVRKGVLKFRGWERKEASLGKMKADLVDHDFSAKYEQKGVDLRIGLDIMTLTESRSVEMLILMTSDTDLIPALKLARSRGMQVAGVCLPNRRIIPEIKPHLDIFRQVSAWPTSSPTT